MPSDLSQSNVHTIVGGTVIDPANNISAKLNIFIEHCAVIEVSDRLPESDKGVIDATGMIVTPGFIDLHAHLREPGFEYKEDIATGSAAAAAGGYTTILCMPNTNPVNDKPQVTNYILTRMYEVSPIRILPIGALSKKSLGKMLTDIALMNKCGVCAFSDDGSCLNDDALMKLACEIAKKHSCIVINHAEDFSLSGDARIHMGDVAKRLKLPGIPREAEDHVIERDIRIARETRAHVHIAHLSTKGGVCLIREAKKGGLHVTCEVTPHHLVLNEEAVEKYGPNAIMKPPLRSEKDRIALVEGLADGTIDAIATDHAPHTAAEKANLATAAFGVIGFETMLPICLQLVHDGHVTMERFVDALTAAPMRIIGLTCGKLSPFKPADITIFDPNTDVTIDAQTFKSKARNTPFDGWTCKGRVTATIVNGNVVYQGS